MIADTLWEFLNREPWHTPLYFWLVLALWLAFGMPHFNIEDWQKWFNAIRSVPGRILRRINRIPMPRRKR